MSGLYHTLGIGAESLLASRQGVDTAGHNIANAQVEGYSRQRVNIEGRIPSESRGVVIGNGVYVRDITRSHDKFIERQLNDSNQRLGSSDTYADEMRTLESIFSPEAGATLADVVNEFFGSLQNLSNFPEELAVRAQVRESAHNVVGAFQRVDTSLRSQQMDVNQKIRAETEEITTLLDGIAKLNVEINNIEGGTGSEAGDLRDQQDRLLRKLSQKVDVSYYRSDFGMLTVRGPRQSLLVDMGFASRFGIQAHPGSVEGFSDVVITDHEGKSIKNATEYIGNGRLAGLLQIRDKVTVNLLKQNNAMASELTESFNAVHRQGFGLNDFRHATGRNFFETSANPEEVVRGLKVSDIILRSTDAISAASSPDAPGDNVNVNDLLRLRETKILDNGHATFADYYGNMVGVLGLDVVRAEHTHMADDAIVKELGKRREGVSGVSLDEEAMSLMKWQANFTASSKVITTVDEMLETILNLKR